LEAFFTLIILFMSIVLFFNRAFLKPSISLIYTYPIPFPKQFSLSLTTLTLIILPQSLKCSLICSSWI
jgi:hypothetical protein